MNNPDFGDLIYDIYYKDFGIKDTTDLPFEIDGKGELLTKLDDFSFRIVICPFICGNILLAPAYVVFISQLIRFARACRNFADFLSPDK